MGALSGACGASPARRALLAGIGNPMRRDDGAGPAVVAKAAEIAGNEGMGADLMVAGPLASPLDLLDLLPGWKGAVVVVDATRAGAEPGALTVTFLGKGAVEPALVCAQRRPSTHGVGVIDAYRILAELGCAPESLALVGLEGDDFSGGEGLSPAVQDAVDKAAALVVDLAFGPH